MSVSDEFIEWLSSDTANPVILIEADHAGGTEYLSDRVYIRATHSNPDGIEYLDSLTGDIEIDQEYGELTLGGIRVEHEGELEEWIYYDWRGHSIRAFIGDVDWPINAFVKFADVTNGGIEAPNGRQMAFSIIDKSAALDKTIGDEEAPVLLGRCFNIEPYLEDASLLKFRVHDGPLQSISAVRDNGAQLDSSQYSVNLADGSFTLNQAVIGTITCDAYQADDTASNMIRDICDRVGLVVNSTNLNNFPNNASIGFYTKTQTSASTILSEIAKTVSGKYRFNNFNQLELFRRDIPETADHAFVADDCADASLVLDELADPYDNVFIGYCRNWHTQQGDSTATSLTAEEKELYAAQYKVATQANNIDPSTYPLAGDNRIDTLFYYEEDAKAEAQRVATLYSVGRRLWRVTMYLSAMMVEVGDSISLTYPQYGFDGGANYRVVGTNKNMSRRRLELSLWR